MPKLKQEPARQGRPKASKKLKNFRPPKPYATFPLTAVSGGQWAKRIKGHLFYFGRWGNVKNGVMEPLPDYGWEAALKLYEAQAADLHAGREPRTDTSPEALTIKAMCNDYRRSKVKRLETGEIKAATLHEYTQTCELLIKLIGGNTIVDELSQRDFENLRHALAKKFKPVGLRNQITKIRSIFKHSKRLDLIPDESFKKPSAATLRKHRKTRDKQMFEPDELRLLLNNAPLQLKAMITLALNCGFGNTDCGLLKFSHLDLDNGWVEYERNKTGVDRRAKLWDETVEALRAVILKRGKPASKADQDIVFLTKYKSRWARDIEHWSKDETGNPVLKKVVSLNAVTGEFAKLMKACGLSPGRNFYALRHTYRTIADETLDQPGIAYTMGHADPTVAGYYRERIAGSRLERIAEHVRQWVFGKGGAK